MAAAVAAGVGADEAQVAPGAARGRRRASSTSRSWPSARPRQRAELAAAPEVVATVPYFDRDIVDLAGLLRLGDAIWR